MLPFAILLKIHHIPVILFGGPVLRAAMVCDPDRAQKTMSLRSVQAVQEIQNEQLSGKGSVNQALVLKS